MLNTPTLNRLMGWFSRIQTIMNPYWLTIEFYKDSLDRMEAFPEKEISILDQIVECEYIASFGFSGFPSVSNLDNHLLDTNLSDTQKRAISEALKGDLCRQVDIEWEFWSLCQTPADIPAFVRIFKVKLKEFLEMPESVDLQLPNDIFSMKSDYLTNMNELLKHGYVDDRERYCTLRSIGETWWTLKRCSERVANFLEECMSMTDGYQEVGKIGKHTHDKTVKYNPSDVLENYHFWNDQPNRQGRRNIFEGVSEDAFLRMIDEADFSPIFKPGLKGRVKFNIYILSKIMGSKWGETSANRIQSTLRECSGNTNFEECEELKSLFSK